MEELIDAGTFNNTKPTSRLKAADRTAETEFPRLLRDHLAGKWDSRNNDDDGSDEDDDKDDGEKEMVRREEKDEEKQEDIKE